MGVRRGCAISNTDWQELLAGTRVLEEEEEEEEESSK